MKILYLFSGERNSVLNEVALGKAPDTQLYGFNHFKDSGLDVETKNFYDVYPKLLGKFLGFRLRHLMLYFETTKYDIVFGASILYMMIFKNLFKPKTRYVLLNTSLNRFLIVHKNNPIILKFIHWMLSGIDKIVCLSNYQLNQLEKEFGINKEKLVFVPLGVDEDYHKYIYNNRKDYILSVGRDNGRDYKTLIDVASKSPNRKFEIVCNSRNLKGIESIPDNVKVTFDISKGELKKKYEEAKILLLLTHGDAYGDGSDCSGQTVLLDAAASGLPIIASRKKYISDYFEEEKEILLVDFYSSDDVLKKIENLEKGSLLVTFGSMARKKVENFFSTRKMADSLTKVFRDVYQ